MDRLAVERERSAFTWFLRSVMEDGSGLAGREETLRLLSHAMGDDPVRMQVGGVLSRVNIMSSN